MKTIRIRMIESATLGWEFGPSFCFHKGRTYPAFPATNQPEWKERGKVFVHKKATPDKCLLLTMADYTAA